MSGELILIFSGALIILAVMVIVQRAYIRQLKTAVQNTSGRPKPIHISEPTAAQLETQLTAAYEKQIADSVQVFGQDLGATSTRLGEQVSRLTTTVIEEELDAYQKTLEEVRVSATKAMEQIREAVERQRVELQQGMEADVADQRKQLVDRFTAKMGDVVSSYIAESLGGGVDLGSQMEFILASLEEHKDDIRKDLLGDL